MLNIIVMKLKLVNYIYVDCLFQKYHNDSCQTMKISRVDLSGGVAYRGEGNANLVVSLVGSRTILRYYNRGGNIPNPCVIGFPKVNS